MVAAIPMLACVELVKALRWHILMGAGRLDFAQSMRALVAGQLTNALVPLHAGEVVSVGLLKAEGGPLVAGSAALAATKALDALTLAAIAAAVLGAEVLRHANAALLGALAVLLALIALAVFRGPAGRKLHSGAVARKLHLAELLDVAAGVRDARVVAVLAGASAAVWIAGLAANWLVLLAVGVAPSLELAARMLVAGYVVGLLPAPPARLGVFEGAIAAALIPTGVGLGQAVTAAVALHACQLAELGLLLGASFGWARWAGRSGVPAARQLP